jgi:hypothetical protein
MDKAISNLVKALPRATDKYLVSLLNEADVLLIPDAAKQLKDGVLREMARRIAVDLENGAI